MLACAGCGSEAVRGDLSLDPVLERTYGGIRVTTGIAFEPTPAMLEALESGVDLRVDLVTRVSRRFGPVALPREKRTHPITLRFLPLTEQWQLTMGEDQQTFPRLWLLLDRLEQPRPYSTGLSLDRAGQAHWQVQVRASFNRGALPSPMHLPSLFSDDWRLSSRLHTWQINPS
ncbi:MAG: DUF4390 domain-containing protein [Candidatus Wenzhouxiangella sp. M2_3B_020]